MLSVGVFRFSSCASVIYVLLFFLISCSKSIEKEEMSTDKKWCDEHSSDISWLVKLRLGISYDERAKLSADMAAKVASASGYDFLRAHEIYYDFKKAGGTRLEPDELAYFISRYGLSPRSIGIYMSMFGLGASLTSLPAKNGDYKRHVELVLQDAIRAGVDVSDLDEYLLRAYASNIELINKGFVAEMEGWRKGIAGFTGVGYLESPIDNLIPYALNVMYVANAISANLKLLKCTF